jgi:hypothetical protein
LQFSRRPYANNSRHQISFQSGSNENCTFSVQELLGVGLKAHYSAALEVMFGMMSTIDYDKSEAK